MPSESFQPEQALYRLMKNPNKQATISLTFDTACEEIKSSSIYADPTCKVLITEDTIYFGHSFYEIILFFPLLKKFFGSGSIQHYMRNVDEMEKAMTSHSRMDERLLKICGDYDYETGTLMSPTNPIFDRRGEIIFSAVKWKKSLGKNEVNQNNIVNNPIKLDEIPALLLEHQGLILGETHTHRYPKKVLIDNMQKFKENGLNVIFLEHVFSNTQRDSFEYYFASDSLIPPLTLSIYLSNLDNGFDLINKDNTINPYSFLGLVIQAKRYGIKIIPIDTDASYCLNPRHLGENKGDDDHRCLMMNFLADLQIKQYLTLNPTDKFITFCGGKHVNASLSGVRGLQESTNCPVIIAQDSNEYNKIYIKMGVDYMLDGLPSLSQEAKELQNIIPTDNPQIATYPSLKQKEIKCSARQPSTIKTYPAMTPQLTRKSETSRLIVSQPSHNEITPRPKPGCCSIS